MTTSTLDPTAVVEAPATPSAEPVTVQPDAPTAARFWNPYMAGIGLGVVLLLSYVILGAGLGASGAVARTSAVAVHAVAPAAVEANDYLGGWFEGGTPMRNYLVFMALGVVLGGLISAYRAGRTQRFAVERGPSVSPRMRLVLALTGGVLAGFAARLAAGCTSGQALSGGAMLLSGSWAFMIAMFVGAFGMARFVRKEWN